MSVADESAVRCPVCGGPARELDFSVDTGRRDVPVTIRACLDTACDAYHPAAEQNI
jgi:hypothetical protein